MTSREIRRTFLDYFAERGHTIVPSAPVVPHGDPTLLFTNAGMNQFKDVFLGLGTRGYTRAVDTQKCIRVSGKHNDLEEVGHDTYHHTFFEMLGNWSFGDYYKKEAIVWAWELLTKVWGLPKERLHATIYRSEDESERDQEAYEVWTTMTDIDPTHLHWFGAKDNFWEMGETGPCGPCSEIHFDRTPDLSGGPLVNVGVPEVMEIWNNVFIQYNRRPDGTLEPLPASHVDTGMGFERICAVMQGKSSNYDTDVFTPLLDEIARLSGAVYSGELEDRAGIAMRVVADHVRALTFAIADGAAPGNTGRGYVLRRLLRRAVKYAYIDLNAKDPILYRLVGILVETMGDVFPEIRAQQSYIERVIRSEEENFGRTLEEGFRQFEQLAAAIVPSADGARVLPGESAFLLFDTFGFPLDLTELIARERGILVDSPGFDSRMAGQKQRARDARRVHSQEASGEAIAGKSEFLYDATEVDAKILAVTSTGVVLDRTPFYAEMGGQLSDHGAIMVGGERLTVSDVQKAGDVYIHIVDADPTTLAEGEQVRAEIDRTRRYAIERNHSATHLVHEALRRVLGGHVQQAGSLVAPGYLRFDFNHFNKVGDEEIAIIEEMVNSKLREAHPVVTEELSIEEARKIPGVKMFFGDKYGSRVRVVTIDPMFSVELCGGTHVRNAAEIGMLKIVSEGSIQSGVRRLEAVSGTTADEILNFRYRELDRIAKRLGVHDREIYGRIEALLEERKQLERELAAVRVASASGGLDALVSAATLRDGVRLVVGRVSAEDNEALKQIGDELRSRLGSNGIGLLGAEIDEKAALVCVVTDDLTGRFSAGKIVGAVAKLVGGGGGGKAHLATAGGKQAEKLDEALAQAPDLIIPAV